MDHNKIALSLFLLVGNQVLIANSHAISAMHHENQLQRSPAHDHINRTYSKEFSSRSSSMQQDSSDIVFDMLKKDNPNLKKIPSSENMTIGDLLKTAEQMQSVPEERVQSNCCKCPDDGCCACCNNCCCQSDCCMVGGCCVKSNGDCCCYCGDDCCTGQCCHNFGKCCETTLCGLLKCLGWCCINFPWEECCEALGDLDFDD